MKNRELIIRNSSIHSIIEQFLENKYVFAPGFIFCSEFQQNVDEFLVFLQNHKRNPIVITNIYWFDFLNSKYIEYYLTQMV
jgi:hypothetical protein